MQQSINQDYRILGALVIRIDGRPVELAGRQQRLLLSALLANANNVVTADTLIDVLWGDTPTDDATTRLAKAVYRLRTTLGHVGGHNPVITRAPGYLLSVGDDQVDSGRFAMLLTEARALADTDPSRTLESLEAALALWRGPAWADVADHGFFQPDIARLDALRAGALEELGELMLALGRHDELVARLAPIILQYPLRERFRAQLVAALYLTGRQADALAAYRSFRSYLVAEVGLEPSRPLRQLEQDILHQRVRAGTTLTRVRSRRSRRLAQPRPRSVNSERFIGRRRDLNWLEVLFNRATAGEAPVVALIQGPAGIGKSALVRAFGRVVQANDGRAVLAQCRADQSALATVRDALGTLTDRAPPTVNGAADQSAAGIAHLLAAISPDARVLLAVDDLDADPAGAAEVLDGLATVRTACPILVVGTCRCDPDAFGTTELVAVRRLAGWDEADVAEALSSLPGVVACTPELVASVREETAGVPALVQGVGERLRDMDLAARADRALARAETARNDWTQSRSDLAHSVIARGQLARTAHPDGHEGFDASCPYKGLAPFRTSDAEYYFGRERLIGEMIARLAVDGFLAVVGPSGSGKSSLLAAGLMPALSSGALPGSERWTCRLLRPGLRPLRSLAAAIAAMTGETVQVVEQRVAAGDLIDDATAFGNGQSTGSRLVLLVDQFEEVFTVCSDDRERTTFLRTLVQESTPPEGRILVAIALRADNYGACAGEPDLARCVARNQVLVPPMTESELRRAVVEPARRGGLIAEEALVDAVVTEAAGALGALPLASTALLETWVRRSNRTLTLAGYEQAGGVRGAVGRLAEAVYSELDPPTKPIVRRVFLRLADPGDARTDVRRRAPLDDLAGTAAERVVVAKLIDRRLLTTSEDTVEVAHESLLREWPRLRGWLEEDRDGRRVHGHLADAAAVWLADQRDESGLYRGVRLQAALEWDSAHVGDAGPVEAQFLAASAAAQDRSTHAARRSARWLRVLAVALAALLAVATAAGVVALSQRSAARRQADLARAQALEAEVSRLNDVARTLPAGRRDLALLLSVEGYRLDPSDETAGGLQADVLQIPAGLDRIIRYPSESFLPHLSSDGKLLAVPGANGVTVFDVASGRTVKHLFSRDPREFAVFSGDNAFVAAGGTDGRVTIWNLATGQRSGAPLRVGGSFGYALFDPTNDNRMYGFTDTNELTTWDRRLPGRPRQVRPASHFLGDFSDNPATAAITQDGRYLAAGDAYGGPVTWWNLTTGRQIPGESLGTVGNFESNRTVLPMVVNDLKTILYNPVTGRDVARPISTPGAVTLGPVVSADGSEVAVPLVRGKLAAVQVYEVDSGRAVGPPLVLGDADTSPVGFLPDGRLLLTGNNEAAIWSVGVRHSPLVVRLAAFPGETDTSTFLGTTNRIVSVGQTTDAVIGQDPGTGRSLGPLVDNRVVGPIAANPAGTLIAAADSVTQQIGIYRIAPPRLLAPLPGVPGTAQLAWSPDGRHLAVDYGRGLQIWDVTDPHRPTRAESIGVAIAGRPDTLLYRPDGKQVLISDNEQRRITLIDLTTGVTVADRHVAQLGVTQTGQIAFSPDSRLIAVDSGNEHDGSLIVYNAELDPVNGIGADSGGGVGFLDAGRWLVVTSNFDQANAQLYDAATLQQIGIPFPITSVDGPLATNAAGTLFSETEDTTPLVWKASPASWVALGCHTAGRNLTHVEWQRYLPGLRYRATCPHWPAGP